MSAVIRLAPDIAWVEGETGGRTDHVVWVTNLDTGVQYELSGTAWLIWMLISDGFNDLHRLHDELKHIHAELDTEEDAPAITEGALVDFVTDLQRDGLLVED